MDAATHEDVAARLEEVVRPALAETTFRHPRSWGWRIGISTPVWLFGGGGMLWISTAAPLVFAIPLALMGAFGILTPLTRIFMWASSVTVTEGEISAVTYAGIRTRMRWEDIRRVEQTHHFAFDCSEFVRLVGTGRSFIFTDALDGYRELMDLLGARASHAPGVPLPHILCTLVGAGFRNKMPGT